MPCLYNAPPDDRRCVMCNQLQCLINALICTTIAIIIISGGLYYGILCHTVKKKATLLFEDRMEYPDGAILEMRIWKLPEHTEERPYGLKYSLFYGFSGLRIIGYDNERGKGGHRHYREHEEPYVFSTVERLVADFLNDVERERSDK